MTVLVQPRFDTEIFSETKYQEPPKYAVILYNDNQHHMEEVINILMEILSFPKERATKHTLEAHHTGRSILFVTHYERAEFYHLRLKGRTLITDLEKM